MLNKDWTAQLDSYSEFDTEGQARRGRASTASSATARGPGMRTSSTAYRSHAAGERQPPPECVQLRGRRGVRQSRSALPVNPRRSRCRVTRDPQGAATVAALLATRATSRRAACRSIPSARGAISTAAKAYAFGFLHEASTCEQQVRAFNATGDLFEGFGAGTIRARQASSSAPRRARTSARRTARRTTCAPTT